MKKRRLLSKIIVYIFSLSLVTGYFTVLSDNEQVKAEDYVNTESTKITNIKFDMFVNPVINYNDDRTNETNEYFNKTNYGYIESPWMRDVPVVEEDISLEEVESRLTNTNGLKSGNIKTEVPLPSAYPYSYIDVENLNKYFTERLLPLKDQDQYGLCWCFGSVGAIEHYLLFNNLKDRNGVLTRDTIDYSELHLAYFTYHNNINPLIPGQENGKTLIPYGTSFLDIGGNESFAIRSLLKWYGVVNENKAQYKELENVKKDPDVMSARKGLSDNISYKSDDIRLKNAYYINLEKNVDFVKQAVRKNGCVSMGISMDENLYFDWEHNSYYNYVDTMADHSVDIVGWDDNFPKENFKKEAARDGAWLIRNSWMDGTNSGSGELLSCTGYFWASYDDTSYDKCAVVYETENVDTDLKYDNNYYYTNTFYENNWKLTRYDKIANVFTVQGEKGADKETISAVIIETNDANVDYSISIYSVDEAGNPSVPLNNPTTGKLTFMGAYTIELDYPVTLDRGTTFAIVIEGDTDKIALESNTNWNTMKVNTGINPGESFMFSESQNNNESWEDLYNKKSKKYGNFCIQVLTIDSDIKIPKIEDLKRDAFESKTDSIKLIWDNFSGADGYKVYRFDVSYDLSNPEIYDVSENSFTDTGLKPNSRHYYRVVPVISGEEKLKSASKIITADVKPSYDENIVPILDECHSDFILGHYGEYADGCIVKYRRKGSSEWKDWVALYGGANDGVEDIWKADLGYLYREAPGLFEVQITPYFYNVHDEIGYGKTVIANFAKPYDSPKNFKAEYDESNNTALLIWDPVKNASSYVMICFIYDNEQQVLCDYRITDQCRLNYEIQDVEPGTEYIFYVAVFDEEIDKLEIPYLNVAFASIKTPRAIPDSDLFKIDESSVSTFYNGQEHGVVLEAVNKPVTGGAITIYYKSVNDDKALYTTELPVDAGRYSIMIDVEETGKYFEGTGITDDSWYLDILPAQLTIIPDEGIIKDLDMQPELTYKYTGNILGETPAFTGSLSVEDIEGEHRITLGTLSLVDNEMFKAKNYVLKMTDGTVLITYIGDTNGDGVVTQDDVIYLKHYLAGGYNANVSLGSADIDKDNLITPMDVTLLERYLAQADKNVA